MPWGDSKSGGTGVTTVYDDIGDGGLARGDSYLGHSGVTTGGGDISGNGVASEDSVVTKKCEPRSSWVHTAGMRIFL